MPGHPMDITRMHNSSSYEHLIAKFESSPRPNDTYTKGIVTHTYSGNHSGTRDWHKSHSISGFWPRSQCP